MERERDLVDALRAELAAIEPARACCRRAERAGLGNAATGRARSPGVARLAARLAGHGAADEPTFDWTAAAEHCRIAWLRGLFLSRGSLSLRGGTHLEIVVPSVDGDAIAAHLAEMGLPAGRRLRRGRSVLTWKDREQVLTFLRRTGASAAALELESRGVTRALRGQLNRALNAESANLRRSVAVASRQIAAIELLERAGELEHLPALERSVAGARREEAGSTLSDIALRLGVSRARVQRAMERIEVRAARIAAADMG